MLTCSVDTDDSSRWRYRWFRRTTGPVVEIFMRNRNISITEGGIYWCRGEKSDLKILTENSNMLTIHKIGECSNLFHSAFMIASAAKNTDIYAFISVVTGYVISFQQGCCDSEAKLHPDIQW